MECGGGRRGFDELHDDELQVLLRKYQCLLSEPEPEGKREETEYLERLQRVEEALNGRRDEVRRRKTTKFIERAKRFRSEQMESNLMRHLKEGSSTAGMVVEYDGAVMYDDADIVHNAARYCHGLYGEKSELRGVPDAERMVVDLLERSHDADGDAECRLFDLEELRAALKHFGIGKAKGIDLVSYYVLREMSRNDFFGRTLLSVINTIYLLSVWPERLNVVKLLMLRKRDVVSTFRDFRGISIMMNLKCIVKYMVYQRTRCTMERAAHPNQAAYKKGHSVELLVAALTATFNYLAARNDAVYAAITDIDRCFDCVNRNGVVLRLGEIGVDGRNLRLIHDDLMTTIAEVVVDGVHSQQIPIRDGNSQGGVDSGTCANLYMRPALEKTLAATTTLCYGKNLASVTYSDDGMKIATSLDALQRSIDAESAGLRELNMVIKPAKTIIIKYSRKRKVIRRFVDERPITVNGEAVHWTPSMNNLKFCGYYLNFNKLSFIKYHVEEKVRFFMKARSTLFSKRRIGGNMPIGIQLTLYLSVVRPAFVFGMRGISLTVSQYLAIDRVQHSFLTTIIGLGLKANSTSIRLALGIPKLSDFVKRATLFMYWDAVMAPVSDSENTTENLFAEQLARNYDDFLEAIQHNGDRVKGLPNQWRFSTMGWASCVESFGLNSDYKFVHSLPITKSQWRSVVNRRHRQIYRSELHDFLHGNGKVIDRLFGNDLMRRHRRKIYDGFMDDFKLIYGDNVTSSKLSLSVGVLLNSTKLNWAKFSRSSTSTERCSGSLRFCPLCSEQRVSNAAWHLIFDCHAIRGPKPIWQATSPEVLRCVDFMEGLQATLNDLS